PAPAPAPAAAAAQTQKLTGFLDGEFEQVLKLNPQLATTLGRKENQDQLNDASEAAQLKQLEWQRGSVARMKAQFPRATLSPEGQISYDMWIQSLDSAELAWTFRRYDYPFGAAAAHSGTPSFLISSHLVGDAADMAAYNARLRQV